MSTDRQTHAPEQQGDAPCVSIADRPEESRFGVVVDGALAGYATYRDVRAGRAFEHTEVAAGYEGMGLASQLIRYALDEARAAGRKVLPFCPFVRAFIKRHPDYLELIEQPQRFDLNG